MLTFGQKRFAIGLGLFCLLSIISSIRAFIAPAEPENLTFAKYVQLLEPVKSQLPPNIEVSFVCDGDLRNQRDARKSGSLTECESRLVMAQSILAPRRLRNDKLTDLIKAKLTASTVTWNY